MVCMFESFALFFAACCLTLDHKVVIVFSQQVYSNVVTASES